MSETPADDDRDAVAQAADQGPGEAPCLATGEHAAGPGCAGNERASGSRPEQRAVPPDAARSWWGGPLLAFLVLVLTVLLVSATR